MKPVQSITIVECRAMAAASRKLVRESRRLLAALEASRHTSIQRWRSIAPGLPREVRHWSAVLGCSQAELLSAIAAAGVMVCDVRAELARRRSLSPPLAKRD